MEIPNFLDDIFDNKIEASISYAHGGSYSVGLLVKFNKPPSGYKKHLFLKLIPICDTESETDLFLNFNANDKVFVSKKQWFHNEVKIQSELYEKTDNFPICLKIYDSFVVNNMYMTLFFRKLIRREKKQMFNIHILESCIFDFQGQISLGVIVMEYLDSSMAFKTFSSCYTISKTFGKHFYENQLLNHINNNENNVMVFYFTQIISAILIMFKLGYIHNDLHFGNILISEYEICSPYAFDEHLRKHFTGRVYIIDFGNAYCMEQTKNFVLKKTNKHHEDIHKTSDIIHLLGKKVLMDGYNFKEKHFISKWYIYDWFINVFFNKSNVTIKSDIIEKIEYLVNEFDENKEVHEKTEVVESKKCFCLF